GRLRGGESVLILGAGSGVSTIAVSLAVQAGARVVVTSSSQEKIDRAEELGAGGGGLYTDEGWPEAAGAVGPVLGSVVSSRRDSLRALRRGGRLVVFGGTGGPEVTLDVRALYLGWYSIRGTTMGSGRDFEALLRMVEGGRWGPVIDSVRPLAEVESA